VSLCDSIILGRGWDEEKGSDVSPPQTLKAKMVAMLDVLRIADSDELQTDQLSVACSIASLLAMLWVKIRLVTSVDLHNTHEKLVTRATSRNAMERFISMLLLNDDFWGLLMRLITRYTSVNISSSHHDQVEIYLGKYPDRQNATKRTCLEISLVSSCLRIVSSWANVSIDQISSSSKNHSVAAVDILLRSSAILAEILVSVLSFCHANLERAYLVHLQDVADACLNLIQLSSAQLLPLAVTHYSSSHHHSAESAEVG
jgi:hypothetical protein